MGNTDLQFCNNLSTEIDNFHIPGCNVLILLLKLANA